MRLLACVAGIAICASAAAVADPASKARADKLFDDGRKYLATKEYALACTAFEQSQAADPAIGTELNIALCYEDWGKTASAYRAYREAERLAKLKFDSRSKGARKKVDELAPRVPHLRLDLPIDADRNVVILFDGKELAIDSLADELLVDPGKHQIEARIPGHPAKVKEFELKDGSRTTMTIDVPAVLVVLPPPPPPPRRKGRLYGGVTLISVGVVGMGVASVVALQARADYNDKIQMCPQFTCTTRAAYDATQSARRRANYMTFVGAGGIVLAGLGLYLAVTSHGVPQESPRSAQLVPIIGGDQIGVALGGSL
jgi:tetratricopeptide (TPR) repeat protein